MTKATFLGFLAVLGGLGSGCSSPRRIYGSVAGGGTGGAEASAGQSGAAGRAEGGMSSVNGGNGGTACGSPTDPKNCGSCGFDCTALTNVKPDATDVACNDGVCSVPPNACLDGFGHCSSQPNDGCEAKLTDPQNCGNCSVQCTGATPLCTDTNNGPICAATCAPPTADVCVASCVDLGSDPTNCGTCGHDCTALANVNSKASGIECRSGACFVPPAACNAGYGHCSTRADDGCETNLKTETDCGACGTSCMAPTGLCSGDSTTASCSSSCVTPLPNLCGAKCVDFQADPLNCGACGHDCTGLKNVKSGATGVECRSGSCYVPPTACSSGFAHCSAQPDDGCEADLTAPAHCGSCSLGCSGTTPLCSVQSPAKCLPSCAGTSPDVCGTQCVNLSSDYKNCGSCGHDCSLLASVKQGSVPPAVQCVSGSCVLQPAACVSGTGHCTTNSNSGCETDLTRPETCGSCATVCSAPTGLCSTSGSVMCSSSCVSPNPDLCGSKCVNKSNDPTNCGTCGHDCTALGHLKTGAAVSCNTSGGCVVPAGTTACAPNFANCTLAAPDTDGCETPTTTNTNCGGCGVTCNLANATSTCATGTCAVAGCNTGFGDCTSAPGCETRLNTLTDCGACGTSCSLANATSTCATGACAVSSCNNGFGDCTSAPGCETPLNTTAHCGTCNTVCPTPTNSTPACTGGSCTFSCNASFSLCGGACLNLNTDAANCGACGHSCLGGTCAAGACQPATVATGIATNPGVFGVDASNVYFQANDLGSLSTNNAWLVPKTATLGTPTLILGEVGFSTFPAVIGTQLYIRSKGFMGPVSVTKCTVANCVLPPTPFTQLGDVVNSRAATVFFNTWFTNSTMDTLSFEAWDSASTTRFHNEAIVSTGLSSLSSFAAGSSVYWIFDNGISRSLFSVDMTTDTRAQLAGNLEAGAIIVDVNAASVLILGRNTNNLARVPLPLGKGNAAPDPLTVIGGTIGSLTGATEDASRVYWLDSAGTVSSCVPATCNATVAVRANGQTSSAGFFQDSTALYWGRTTPNSVMRLAK